jgi:hypothetical protein
MTTNTVADARLAMDRAWNEMDIARDVAEKERDPASRHGNWLAYDKRYQEYQAAAAAYTKAMAAKSNGGES